MPSSENGPDSEESTSDQDPPKPVTAEDAWRVFKSFLGHITKIRVILHNIFGKGDEHDSTLHLCARVPAGAIGPFMSVPPAIIYYLFTSPEALHQFFTVELTNGPYIWGAIIFTAVIGGGIGASHKKGTFFKHAWRSLVDAALLYFIVIMGLRFGGGIIV